MTLHHFSLWLSHTPLSSLIQDVSWIIPSVQTIHILSVAAVVSSTLMIDLRALGLIGRNVTTRHFAHRYGGWVWAGVLILLCTGSILVIGEPARSLENWVFQTKMVLLLVFIGLMGGVLAPMRQDPQVWETRARRPLLYGLAVLSMLDCIGIVFAGRWIAYAL